MNNEDALISKLLSETCNDVDDKDQPNVVVDLRNYFEKKLNEVEFISLSDYLVQNDLKMSQLKFRNKTKCYRLSAKDTVIDFPSNWSVFSQIESDDLIFVDQSIDQDFLLDIFSEINGAHSNLAILKEDKIVKIIYLPEESSMEHVKWFRGYLVKRSQESENTASENEKDAA